MFSTRNIRCATEAEREYYGSSLYPLQDQVCRLIGLGGLYLSGGTALSRVYFKHRYSDDLDFFYNGHLHPKENFAVDVRESIERVATIFKVEMLLDSDYFKRIMVIDRETILKVEYIYEPYTHFGEFVEWGGCFVDSLENIGVNKITAAQNRKTAKDFVDLYFLLQKLDLERLIQGTKEKIVPLDYESAVLAFSDCNLEGTAVMTHSLEPAEMNLFGSDLMRKLINHARTV
ncbi:MAG: nucleotidyl transferase AbiEii/AbiGii toxin family protein [Deltaproteobacteria bacterium]